MKLVYNTKMKLIYRIDIIYFKMTYFAYNDCSTPPLLLDTTYSNLLSTTQ